MFNYLFIDIVPLKVLSYVQERPILTVVNSIKDAEEIIKLLKNEKIKVRTLLEANDEEKKALKQKMKAGDVMIGTFLASRGIDLPIDNKVKYK